MPLRIERQGKPPLGTRLRPRLRSALLGLLACHALAAPAQVPAVADAAQLVMYAIALVDTPYRYGGTLPGSGFDCSGFVRYVHASTSGLELPRRSEDMRRLGTSVNRDDVEPGDLVFFNTLGRPWSHVAIAIGDGRFVHAPARGGRVRIEPLADPYWRARYNGARRLDGHLPGRDGAAVVASVETRPGDTDADQPIKP